MNHTEKPELDLEAEPFLEVDKIPLEVKERCIYSVISGSRAYGTNIEGSDTDTRAVFLETQKQLFGMGTIKQVTCSASDTVYYTLRRFIELAYKNNVHALEMLYMGKENITICKPEMQKVINNRHLFLSKNIGYSFGGYAFQQLCKMRTKIANGTGRQELIQKHGADVKLQMHSLRIYEMATECLLTGELVVRRPNAKELLEVRAGKYSPEEFAVFKPDSKKPELISGIVYEAKMKFEEAFQKSRLQNKPNYAAIENLLVEIQSEALIKEVSQTKKSSLSR